MISTSRLIICVLLLLAYNVTSAGQQTTSQSGKPSQSTEDDRPFCPSKEVGDSFCSEKHSENRPRGCTELMTAAELGDLKRVRELLASGAQVDVQIAPSVTALGLAAIEGHLEVVKVLLAAGSNPNIIGLSHHSGPFATWMAAMNRCNKDWFEIFEAMLTAGVELNPNTALYMSPLGAAIHKDDPVMIKAVLQKGADVNLTDPETGETLLMRASRYSDVEVVRTLLDAGAEINAKDKEGRTALFLAGENLSKDDVIKLLKRRGAKDKE